MPAREFLQVDPATLHLPGSRRDGADPMKLHHQLAQHGTSVAGMPPLEVKRGSDGELVIYDGVTRATRVAKYCPGTLVPVEVTGTLKGPVGGLPTGGREDMTTREQVRSDLLAALSELGRLRPEWRLGQMLANVTMTAGRLDAGGVWDLEDEEALAAARELLAQSGQRETIPT